ncbi:MAG TPA: hypothetical protein VJN18_35100 [Polyangiaceae bacterium]|nr:hypothetical protein [Polyangiaceae bacterium]
MTDRMAAACWLSLALALGSLNCSGEQFISAEPEGSGGSESGSSSKLPPSTTGGGTVVVPGPGGSIGGSGQMVEPGDVTPQPSGGTGSGTGGGMGQSGSGTEPDPRELVTIDLVDCGPNAFGTGIVPTLYSTLDSAVAITEPMIGELGFVSNDEGDYHGDHCSLGINVDQSYDYIKYHYADNGVSHYSPVVGSMDFWYMPSYEHTDGLNHHLFGTANWATAGGFRMRKAAENNDNALQVIVASSTLQTMELSVPADRYSLSPGEWTRITLIWYLGADMPERFVRLFMDGTLVGEIEAPNSFFMASDEGGYFTLGVWDFGDPEHAAGIFDDFKVFARGP